VVAAGAAAAAVPVAVRRWQAEAALQRAQRREEGWETLTAADVPAGWRSTADFAVWWLVTAAYLHRRRAVPAVHPVPGFGVGALTSGLVHHVPGVSQLGELSAYVATLPPWSVVGALRRLVDVGLLEVGRIGAGPETYRPGGAAGLLLARAPAGFRHALALDPWAVLPDAQLHTRSAAALSEIVSSQLREVIWDRLPLASGRRARELRELFGPVRAAARGVEGARRALAAVHRAGVAGERGAVAREQRLTAAQWELEQAQRREQIAVTVALNAAVAAGFRRYETERVLDAAVLGWRRFVPALVRDVPESLAVTRSGGRSDPAGRMRGSGRSQRGPGPRVGSTSREGGRGPAAAGSRVSVVRSMASRWGRWLRR
jgi:hypothetical protein